MGLCRSQKGEKDIETEWKCLRHNDTGSTIKARVNYLLHIWALLLPAWKTMKIPAMHKG